MLCGLKKANNSLLLYYILHYCKCYNKVIREYLMSGEVARVLWYYLSGFSKKMNH